MGKDGRAHQTLEQVEEGDNKQVEELKVVKHEQEELDDTFVLVHDPSYQTILQGD